MRCCAGSVSYRSNPGKHVLDDADYTGPIRRNELECTRSGMYTCLERSRSRSGNRSHRSYRSYRSSARGVHCLHYLTHPCALLYSCSHTKTRIIDTSATNCGNTHRGHHEPTTTAKCLGRAAGRRSRERSVVPRRVSCFGSSSDFKVDTRVTYSHQKPMIFW